MCFAPLLRLSYQVWQRHLPAREMGRKPWDATIALLRQLNQARPVELRESSELKLSYRWSI